MFSVHPQPPPGALTVSLSPCWPGFLFYPGKYRGPISEAAECPLYPAVFSLTLILLCHYSCCRVGGFLFCDIILWAQVPPPCPQHTSAAKEPFRWQQAGPQMCHQHQPGTCSFPLMLQCLPFIQKLQLGR